MKTIDLIFVALLISGCSSHKDRQLQPSPESDISDTAKFMSVPTPIEPQILIAYAPAFRYPPQLNSSADTGSVTVACAVDSMGIASTVTVVRSTNPSFDSLGLALALRYRWQVRGIDTYPRPKGVFLAFRFDPTHKTERIPQVRR